MSRQLSTSQHSDNGPGAECAPGDGPSSTALDAWARLLRGHASLRRSLSAELEEDHGLNVTGYEALLLLSRAEDGLLRRVDLADGLGLSPSGVTRLLDGLERQGLVDKATCESDARVTYAVLTDAGRRRLEESSRSHVATIEAVFAERFEAAELVALADLLGRLPGAGGASGAACSADG
ncbi:MAG TPA: MarR family winged helix-turn-helix transcriptional regulator [Thermoleophilaceae bacterium]|nr:MarR family winged helix-turn-helix transcriptional regulator [Thermoleophilaceae bacterium]